MENNAGNSLQPGVEVFYSEPRHVHTSVIPKLLMMLVVFVLVTGGILAFNYVTHNSSSESADTSTPATGQKGLGSPPKKSSGTNGQTGDEEVSTEPFPGVLRASSVLGCRSNPNKVGCVKAAVATCANSPNLPECLEEEDVCVINPLATLCLPVECPDTLEEVADQPFGACGSTEQIYVVNAASSVMVSAIGPETYSGTTDSLGGLVLRDVEPGAYVVTIGDTDDVLPGVHDSYAVTVTSESDHPSQDLYESQEIVDTEGYIKMRDNVFLDYHLEMPTGGCSASSKCDVIITYSGYSSGLGPSATFDQDLYDKLLPEGYAVMGVNMRGSGCSGGSFKVMEDMVGIDGYDMVETVGAQDWVDQVALADKSWPGLSQLFVAATQPPSLDIIMPGAFIADFYRDIFYPGGIKNSGFPVYLWGSTRDLHNGVPSGDSRFNDQALVDQVCNFNRRLHLQSKSIVSDAAAHPLFDEHWDEKKVHAENITVPTLLVLAWQDEQTRSRAASILEDIPDSTPVRLVGSNGGHNLYWTTNIWPEALEFANVYLKGDAQDIADYEAEDPIKIFLETNSSGVARTSFTLPEFPVSGTGERFELGADLLPDDADSGANESSTFSYSPNKNGITWTSTAQDKVKFTSTALGSPRVFAGFASTDVWVRTSEPDMDLRVVISEVRADGKEMFVQEGWLRASHRALDTDKSTELRPVHLNNASVPLEANTPTLMRIEMLPFVHAFRAGSKIRVIIAPAPGPENPPAFPLSWGWLYDPIPGTFDVTIMHDATHESSLVMHEVTSPSAGTILSGISSLPTCTTSSTTVWNQPCRNTQ